MACIRMQEGRLQRPEQRDQATTTTKNHEHELATELHKQKQCEYDTVTRAQEFRRMQKEELCV